MAGPDGKTRIALKSRLINRVFTCGVQAISNGGLSEGKDRSNRG